MSRLQNQRLSRRASKTSRKGLPDGILALKSTNIYEKA
jgi:hypothetical protein